jgi:predicted MFS family arabinose efflux permease
MLVRMHLPHAGHTRKDVRVDFVGAALCVVGLGAFVFGFIEQPRLGWSSPAVWGTIIGGAACLVWFVVYESRTEMPMLPLRLFRSRNFAMANLETLAVYGGLSAWGFFLTLFLQQIAGYTPFQAGLASVPLTIGMFALSRWFGRLSMRFGPRFFMSAGPLLGAVSILPLVRLPTDPNYWTDLFPSMVGFSVALSLTVAPLTTTVLSDAGPGDAGIASGINNAIARVAGLIAIAMIGVAAAGSTDHLSAEGFHRSMLIVSVLLAIGGVIGVVGIRNPTHAHAEA